MSNTALVPELGLGRLKILREPATVCISRWAPRAARCWATCPPQLAPIEGEWTWMNTFFWLFSGKSRSPIAVTWVTPSLHWPKNNKRPRWDLDSYPGPIRSSSSHPLSTFSETWTRFHVLNFEEEDNGAPMPNNMTTWTELHNKLRDDFTFIRRHVGFILVDAKTKENAKPLSNISQLGINSVTTSRDLCMNATRATVLVD